MRHIHFSLFVLIYLYQKLKLCYTESIYFMDCERPVVTYIDKKVLKSFSIMSRRVNRTDPRHYVSVYLENLVYFDNKYLMHFYFHQWLTNRYRPSFVEIHAGFCDLLDRDPVFGAQLKRNAMRLNVSCPYPPGKYNLTDMAVPFVPKNFPFSRGRIYANTTLNGKTILSTYIDMEIQRATVRKIKS